MNSIINLGSGNFEVNLNKPIDISMRLGRDSAGAWYLGAPKIEPVVHGDWIGRVSKGANVNFNRIEFSPHAHGTHTESYGHISKEFFSIGEALKKFFFKSKLVSLRPEKIGEDLVFTKDSIAKVLKEDEAESLIVRSLPNNWTKKTRSYDHSNWPYLNAEAAAYIRDCGIHHLIIDLPSIDKEKGEVKAHQAFWNYPGRVRKHATITEMVFIPSSVKDGVYILNLQVANFENDAAPSRPVLFEIK